MPRIFLKHVTPEGRSEVEPDLARILSPIVDTREDKTPPFKESNAVGIGDLIRDDRGEGEEGGDMADGMNIDSAVSMYLVMRGIRSMIHYFAKMGKNIA